LEVSCTTEDGEAIAGETVDFKVGDVLIGSMETDANGVAAYPYNPPFFVSLTTAVSIVCR
jgi:hypothetical protein